MNIGIANIDNITGKSTITQFKREYYKDSCTYDDLERQISIFSPYECIIVAKILIWNMLLKLQDMLDYQI